MKTTSQFPRLIIALLISLVCMDSYAQKIPKFHFSNPSFWGAAAATGSRALQAQQIAQARQNVEQIRLLNKMINMQQSQTNTPYLVGIIQGPSSSLRSTNFYRKRPRAKVHRKKR